MIGSESDTVLFSFHQTAHMYWVDSSFDMLSVAFTYFLNIKVELPWPASGSIKTKFLDPLSTGFQVLFHVNQCIVASCASALHVSFTPSLPYTQTSFSVVLLPFTVTVTEMGGPRLLVDVPSVKKVGLFSLLVSTLWELV